MLGFFLQTFVLWRWWLLMFGDPVNSSHFLRCWFFSFHVNSRKIRPGCWHQFGVQGAAGCKHLLLWFWQQHLRSIFSQDLKCLLCARAGLFWSFFLHISTLFLLFFHLFFTSCFFSRPPAILLAPYRTRRGLLGILGRMSEVFGRYQRWWRDAFLCFCLRSAVKTSAELLLSGSCRAYIMLCVEVLSILFKSGCSSSAFKSTMKEQLKPGIKKPVSHSQPHISKHVMNRWEEPGAAKSLWTCAGQTLRPTTKVF